MASDGINDHILGSSTHQYPNGTMTTEITRAIERGFPVFEWCWRENLRTPPIPTHYENGEPLIFPADAPANPHGWLTLSQVERKRLQVTRNMWDVEYELGEPSIEGRAIDTESVDWMFDPRLGRWKGELGAKLIIEPPMGNGVYAAGADWGKKRDKSIFSVIRIDRKPAKLVAWYHMARQPYPVMIRAFDMLVNQYKAASAFDATGLGTVVEDYTTASYSTPVSLNGYNRTKVFDDYIVGIEGHEVMAPMIEYMYREHKFVTGDDLYGGGHPPDSFVSMALAWWAKDNAHRAIFR